MTPTEILEAAAADVPSLSLTTVYRQLKGLLEESAVHQVDLPGQSARYEAPCFEDAAGGHHHHHFHCEACERVFPIHACPGPMRDLAPKGFQVKRHDVTLHGRCALCVRKG